MTSSLREAAENESKIQAVVNRILYGIIAIDENGVIQIFNPTASVIFGYGPKEVVEKNIDMLTPDSKSKKGGNVANEYLGRRKDGTIFPI